eukprot:386919-Rhodomonas_salina.3
MQKTHPAEELEPSTTTSTSRGRGLRWANAGFLRSCGRRAQGPQDGDRVGFLVRCNPSGDCGCKERHQSCKIGGTSQGFSTLPRGFFSARSVRKILLLRCIALEKASLAEKG